MALLPLGEAAGSVVVAHGLSCLQACGIFLTSDRVCVHALAGGFFATDHQWQSPEKANSPGKHHHFMCANKSYVSSGDQKVSDIMHLFQDMHHYYSPSALPRAAQKFVLESC